MSRYFLHLRNGTDELLDEQGEEFPTVDKLREQVLFAARDLAIADIRDGVLDLRFRIDAENEAGQVVYSLACRDAVTIIEEERSGDVGRV